MESQGKGVGITTKYPGTTDFGDANAVYTPNPLVASDAASDFDVGTPPPLPPDSDEEVGYIPEDVWYIPKWNSYY